MERHSDNSERKQRDGQLSRNYDNIIKRQALIIERRKEIDEKVPVDRMYEISTDYDNLINSTISIRDEFKSVQGIFSRGKPQLERAQSIVRGALENPDEIIPFQNRIIDNINQTRKKADDLFSTAKGLEEQYADLSKKVLSVIDEFGLRKQNRQSLIYAPRLDTSNSPEPILHVLNTMSPTEITARIEESWTRFNETQQQVDGLLHIYLQKNSFLSSVKEAFLAS